MERGGGGGGLEGSQEERQSDRQEKKRKEGEREREELVGREIERTGIAHAIQHAKAKFGAYQTFGCPDGRTETQEIMREERESEEQTNSSMLLHHEKALWELKHTPPTYPAAMSGAP
eukprot:2410756-Rhodomonas_salina.2